MEDRFKFRGYNSEYDEMVYFEIGAGIDDPFSNNIDHEYISTPMQCTGEKDVSGKLIYEGDIVQGALTGAKYEVKFNSNKSKIGSHDQCSIDYHIGFKFGGWDGLKVKVIGNIYEGKDLLK